LLLFLYTVESRYLKVRGTVGKVRQKWMQTIVGHLHYINHHLYVLCTYF